MAPLLSLDVRYLYRGTLDLQLTMGKMDIDMDGPLKIETVDTYFGPIELMG